MIYDVIRYPDPRLETPCDPVTEFNTPELDKLVADMFETMYYHKGVGLAAPQIGVMKQLSVIDISVGEDEAEKTVIINPTITRKEGKQRDEEGCLCFPGFREDVTRAQRSWSRRRTPRVRPTSSSARNCWPGPCSTRSITSTGFSSSDTSVRSSAT